MQKTDLILTVLAVVALLVTGVGVAASGRWTGEHTVTFVTAQSDLVAQGPADAGGSGARFNWTVPANATSATVQLAVTFSGQAVQGGSATVSVRVQMPDGTFAPDTVGSMTIPQGATQASFILDIPVQWAEVPANVRDAKGSEPAGLAWAQPLDFLVVVSQPSDLPVASYGFTASVAGRVSSYSTE